MSDRALSQPQTAPVAQCGNISEPLPLLSSTKQCRERYFNVLDPTIRRTPWLASELDILFRCVARAGVEGMAQVLTESAGPSSVRVGVSCRSVPHCAGSCAAHPALSIPHTRPLVSLCRSHAELGNSWQEIAKCVPHKQCRQLAPIPHTTPSLPAPLQTHPWALRKPSEERVLLSCPPSRS